MYTVTQDGTLQHDERTPGRLARWLGRCCVYGLPGCTCRLSRTYMAFYASLVTSLAAQEEARR